MRPELARFRILDFGFRILSDPIRNPQSAIRCLAALAIVIFPGCHQPEASPGKQSQQAQFRRADRGEALVAAAANQLSDLPSAVDTELRPPAVILDSTKSANGQDVLATCTRSPVAPEGPINYFRVSEQNSRFRSIGVQSGDILKYYVLQDETIDEERQQFGMGRQLAMELIVAQVIDENSLLIEGSLGVEVPFPAKIEIWRYLDDRLFEINQQLATYVERRLPPVGWQPSPDNQVLTQIVTWLNQWLRQNKPKTDWKLDPLVAKVDAGLLNDEKLAAYIWPKALAEDAFQPYDSRLLQEAVWHRDISRWAQGDNFNDVARATALFDWTIRNVQLAADDDGIAHRPWQVLLHGRGTAEQRAWVFAMLARQQGLDVVMLSLPEGPATGETATTGGSNAKFWLPALLLDGQLYLFDTRLGLPIPGPGGEGVATLEQVRKDDALLRQLDFENAAYAVTADALKSVVPSLVADPFDLTRRARQVESKLTGDDHLALSSQPSEVAVRLKSVPDLAEPSLWNLPFVTLRDQLSLGRSERHREAIAFEPFAVRPVLWKARTRHFQGRRPVGKKANEDVIDDHREAAQLYTSKAVRPTDRAIEQTASVDKRRIDALAKLNATLWVGLLSFDDGKYEVAAHWLGRPELSAADSPWAAGARYGLARALEAQGKFEEAIKLLNADTSPQQHGNHLRAKALTKKLEASKPSE